MTAELTGLFDHLPDGTQASGSLTGLPLDRIPRVLQALRQAKLWTHIDIMEPAFAGRHGIPIDHVRELVTQSYRADVHLMVQHPDDWLERVLASRPHRVTVHAERIDEPRRTSEVIRSHGAAPWLAVGPGTKAETAHEAAQHFDGVLVLLLEPGSVGNALATQIEELHLLSKHHPVGADGGIHAGNLNAVLTAGATYAVAGRGLFQRPSREL